MFDFFLNIMMYLIVLTGLMYYFHYKMSLYRLIFILFNLNISFLLIYLDINVIYEIMIALITIILDLFINSFKKEEEDIVLIQNGNLLFQKIVKYYSYSKLISYLRKKKISLDEIACCIKSNNRLIIIKNQEIKSFPVNIILDGLIQEENLKLINKNDLWLKEELLKRNLLVQNIEYAYYRHHHLYFNVLSKK